MYKNKIFIISATIVVLYATFCYISSLTIKNIIVHSYNRLNKDIKSDKILVNKKNTQKDISIVALSNKQCNSNFFLLLPISFTKHTNFYSDDFFYISNIEDKNLLSISENRPINSFVSFVFENTTEQPTNIIVIDDENKKFLFKNNDIRENKRIFHKKLDDGNILKI